MNTTRTGLVLALLSTLLVAACATTPEDEARRQAMHEDIDAILGTQLDSAMYGENLRCLSDMQTRNFRALDEYHLLFEGPGDRLWVNTLRGPCPDLKWGDVLVVRPFMGSRICDTDRFSVADWFDWPWYHRAPWHWGTWGSGMQCTLGEFQPVTSDQVAEIDAVLKRR